MWSRGDIEAELSRLPNVRRLLDDCWCFYVRVQHKDGSFSRYTIYVYTTPNADGLFPYAGMSPQYVREGMLVRGEEILAMAKEERQLADIRRTLSR